MQQSAQNKKSKVVEYFLNHSNFRTFFFQFITSAFLTFMANAVSTIPPFQGHIKDKNIFRQVYVALIIYTIICFSGSICGAMINPAVTLGSFLSKKRQNGDLKLALSYVSAQFTGCFTGFILSKSINNVGGPIYPAFPDSIQLLKECTEEMVATFMLILFILIISTQETTFVYSEAWAQLLIAFVFFFCLTFSTHFQLLNPAVVFGGQIQGMIYEKIEASTLLACTFLALSQLLGAFLAQLFFKTYKNQVVHWKKSMR